MRYTISGRGRRWSLLLFGCLLLSCFLCACGGSAPEEHTHPVVTTDVAEIVTEAATQPADDHSAYSAPIRYLLDRELITVGEVLSTEDSLGHLMLLTVSLGDILERGGLHEAAGGGAPSDQFENLYLYTLGDACSLFYMRTDATNAGAGISFIELDFGVFKTVLESGKASVALYEALTRVTIAPANGRHNPVFTDYFGDPAASGAYLIAETFVTAVAARSEERTVTAPTHYATCPAEDAELVRVTEALRYLDGVHPDLILWEGDRPAGVRVGNREALTPYEKQAILTLYTMDVTFCSFAAEVAVHAMMCDQNFMNSYNRCKIADMAPGVYSDTAGAIARWENEYGFYNLASTAVKGQEEKHPDYKGEYAPPESAS